MVDVWAGAEREHTWVGGCLHHIHLHVDLARDDRVELFAYYAAGDVFDDVFRTDTDIVERAIYADILDAGMGAGDSVHESVDVLHRCDADVLPAWRNVYRCDRAALEIIGVLRGDIDMGCAELQEGGWLSV